MTPFVRLAIAALGLMTLTGSASATTVHSQAGGGDAAKATSATLEARSPVGITIHPSATFGTLEVPEIQPTASAARDTASLLPSVRLSS